VAKTRRLIRIISGGQTGADQGGLLAARDLGIASGGTAPQGWLTETGPQETLLRGFGLSECQQAGYPARTKRNVLDSDGTLLVGTYATGGSALTATQAETAGRPLFHLDYVADITRGEERYQEFRGWLRRHNIRILNVAGNRESENIGIQEFTRAFLVGAISGEIETQS